MTSLKTMTPGDRPGATMNTRVERPHPTPPRPTDPASLIALFAERFPQTFFVYEKRRRPLKIGIHFDLYVALVDEQLEKAAMREALSFYVNNLAYLRNLKAGADRIDLEGEPAGTVAKDAENIAKNKLEWRTDKPKPKSKSKSKPQPHPANAAKPRLTLGRR